MIKFFTLAPSNVDAEVEENQRITTEALESLQINGVKLIRELRSELKLKVPDKSSK